MRGISWRGNALATLGFPLLHGARWRFRLGSSVGGATASPATEPMTEMPSPTPTATPSADDAAPVAAETPPLLDFTASRGAFAMLLFRVSVLTTLTLGIYRFWGRTHVRRYLWARTRLFGEPLEYTGLASELLVGFLVALACLAPLGFSYALIDALLGPGADATRATLEAIYYAVLLSLFQVARFRMWRYRLSRTSWRGIRFGLDGSTWQYLSLAVGWSLVTVLTLGLAYPWTAMALWRYRVQHSRFGTTMFEFAAEARPLVRPWLIAYALPAGVLAALFFAVGGPEAWNQAAAGNAAAIAAGRPLVAVGFVLLLLWPLLFGWYRVVQGRHVIGGIVLGSSRLVSGLTAAPLLGALVLSWLLIGLVSLGAVAMVVITSSPGAAPDDLILPGALAALGVLTLAPVVQGAIFRFALARRLCATTTATDMAPLLAAVQAAREVPTRGEGLADALDVGAI